VDIVRICKERNHDAIVVPAPPHLRIQPGDDSVNWMTYVVHHAPCGVFLAMHPAIPREVVG
jgi:hypothetical protein